jgi:hypothetical protein
MTSATALQAANLYCLTQVSQSPRFYLELKLDFHSDEIDQLADDYAELDVVSVEQLHTNIQALRGLGWSVGQVKALILKCPPLLEISFESFLSFFYNYGATPRVRSCQAH